MLRLMISRFVAVAAMCCVVVLPLVAFSATGAAGQEAKPGGKLTPRLQRLVQPSAATASSADQAALVGLPASGPGALLRLSPDRVLVEIRLSDAGPASVDRLRAAGAQVVGVSGSLRTVTASVRPADLQKLGAADGVESVQEVLSPMVNRRPLGAVRAAAPAAPCNPIISEGDGQLRADVARSQFSVDGTGTTVGVLSDSFDTWAAAPTHASNDVASGALPGPGNPCGYTTAVNVVDDSCTGSCPHEDEGRAMSQIVHGLAPGANLAFATANTGETNFANNITTLAGAPGAKVIVDDFTYFDEPVYQDGPLSNAVTQVRNAGVAYFSSAANNNMIIAGKDVGSYEATVYRGTPCPTLSYVYLDCHDFNPSGGTADNAFDMTVNNNGTLRLELQWAQPWFGVTTDLDLYVLDPTNGAVLASSTNPNPGPGGTQKPFELVSWQNTTGSAKNVSVVVGRYSGPGVRFKLIHIQSGAGGIASVEYSNSTGTDVIGPTIFGHNGAANAFSTAAVPFNNSTTPENYSSHGSVTLLYGPVNGTTPAAALGSPQVAAKPDFAATDGGKNSFFGSFDGVNYRFYGTSAAAPHAAAVAALLRQVNPTVTPAQVGGALASTARSVGGAPALVVGAGLIDADAAAGTFAGLLRVASNPAVPTQISVDGNIADSWGLVWMKESAGPHTVCFAHVDGWTEPSCQTVTVNKGATTTVTGNFTQRGLLRVLNSPAVASAISVDGNPTDEYGMWTDVAIGARAICWGKVAGWNPPPCQNITLTTSGLTVTGSFTACGGCTGQTGVGLLRVTTNPAVPSQITLKAGAGATYIADQWGLTWLEVAAGPYTVCFTHTNGWSEPPCQTVTVTSGATTTVTGSFAQRGFLRVQTSPAVAATILVDGVPRDDWGMWTDMPAGSHTVCFGSVPGFANAPLCQAVTVSAGASTTVTGTYS